MGEHTAISWTHHTFNPWWGCCKVSPGCKNCYAEQLAVHRRHMPIWGPAATTSRKMMGDNHWKEPLKWDRKAAEAGKRARVFCASMADVFEAHPDVVEERIRLWQLIEDTPHLDWLLLTKRPENIDTMLGERWSYHDETMPPLPRNIWLGTSAEDQETFYRRWSELEWAGRMYRPSQIFLSLEPLLGPIDIEAAFEFYEREEDNVIQTRQVDWVIVGGESGPGCRAFNSQWALSIRDQCQEAGIAYFFKQHGGTKKINGVAGGDALDGVVYHQWPDEPGDEPAAPIQQAEDAAPPDDFTQLSMF